MSLQHRHGQEHAGPRQFLVVAEQRRRILEDSQAGQGTIPGAVGWVAIDGEHVRQGVASNKRGCWQWGYFGTEHRGGRAGARWGGWRRDLLVGDDGGCDRRRSGGRDRRGRCRGVRRLSRDWGGSIQGKFRCGSSTAGRWEWVRQLGRGWGVGIEGKFRCRRSLPPKASLVECAADGGFTDGQTSGHLVVAHAEPEPTLDEDLLAAVECGGAAARCVGL